MLAVVPPAAFTRRNRGDPATIAWQTTGEFVIIRGMQNRGTNSVFDAVGGSDGLRLLDSAWHRRVMADEVVSHAFSHGFHPEPIERLAAYWAEALGGPGTYSESYGDENRVVKMHRATHE